MIELRTLGVLELRGCEPRGVDALVSQPKRLGLLTYLAVATPTGFHRRDTLLGLFWPELDGTHARGALRNALSFLRRQLGEAAIVTRGDEVALDRAAFWCDVTAFRACIESGAADEALFLSRGDLLQGSRGRWRRSQNEPESGRMPPATRAVPWHCRLISRSRPGA
jgi:DNA-binding SARP family transcriptional activator